MIKSFGWRGPVRTEHHAHGDVGLAESARSIKKEVRLQTHLQGELPLVKRVVKIMISHCNDTYDH